LKKEQTELKAKLSNLTGAQKRSDRGDIPEFDISETNAGELVATAKRATAGTASWEAKSSERASREADLLML